MQAPSRVQERHHLIGAPGHSLALHYEVLLKEARPTNEAGPPLRGKVTAGPSQERIETCFQVFDDLLVHLGVYQRVMRIVRDELYAAVYSGEFTSGCGRSSPTQPLPWCVIAGRLMGKKSREQAKLKAEVSSLKEQLYTCEADLEKATSSLESHRHDVKDRDGKLHRLSTELRTRAAENERLQKILAQQQHGQERMRQEAELRMYSLRNTIGNLKEDNVLLRQYKTTYDKLQEALSVPHQATPPNQPANSKAELDQHVQTTEKLKQQLLRMRNSLLEEYDVWLTSCISGSEQTQLLPAAIVQQKQNFKKNMAEVSTELSLLDAHAHCLSQRSIQVEDQLKAPEYRALVLPDHPSNPLLAQMQTSSKFAVMIHSSSDNGKTFYSVKEGQICSNCGHKTVVCPHKPLAGGEATLQLPLGSTHIKISQPILEVMFKAEATPTSSKSKVVATPSTGLHYLPPNFNRIWKTFWQQFASYKSVELHTLTAEETLLLANQFCASMIRRDDRALMGEDDTPLTSMESLIRFVEQRYQVASVVPLVTHNFITALSEHHTQHKELLVLCHMLSGDLDGCAVRQLLLLAELVEMIPWNTLKEFSSFASIVYPSLQEEELDHLTMNFVSFGGNKISAQLVLGFLTWQIIRHKDPLLVQFESQLSEYSTRSTGSMLEVEFAEAVDNLVSLVSDQLCRHLYLQSLMQLQDIESSHQTRKALPIKRLSYIACYLHTLSQMSVMKSRVESLAQQIDALTSKPHPPSQPPQSQQKAKLFTMDTARDMATRMKTIAQYR